MRKRNALLLLVLLFIISCGLKKRLFSLVLNNFPAVSTKNLKGLDTIFEPWNNENVYILRMELEEKHEVDYEENGIPFTELSDYSLKDYKLLTKADSTNKNIVEEVYLYLNDFNKKIDSSSVLYMSTTPFKPHVSRLIFSNNKFISTYGINHVMNGKWIKKQNNDSIKIILRDKGNKLTLKGILDEKSNPNMIEFTHVNHPKPMNKKDSSFIAIRNIFEIDPDLENESDSTNIINGIRFFKNKDRTFVHPNWYILGKNFDSKLHRDYYTDSLELWKINEVSIGKTKRQNYFKLNNPDSRYFKTSIIHYKK